LIIDAQLVTQGIVQTSALLLQHYAGMLLRLMKRLPELSRIYQYNGACEMCGLIHISVVEAQPDIVIPYPPMIRCPDNTDFLLNLT
jgi:hypothetical protein